MGKVDDILDIIDVGLQSAVPDPTFGEVSPILDTCIDCLTLEAREGSAWCQKCWDSPRWYETPDLNSIEYVVEVSAINLQQALQNMAEIMESVTLSMPHFTERDVDTTD